MPTRRLCRSAVSPNADRNAGGSARSSSASGYAASRWTSKVIDFSVARAMTSWALARASSFPDASQARKAAEADPWRSTPSRNATPPTPRRSPNAMASRSSCSGERRFFTALVFHANAKELRPPRRQQCVESRACRRADRKRPECAWRLDGRHVFLAEQVELREDDAIRLGGEFRRIHRDLVAQLVEILLPVVGVDGDEERQDPRPLDVAEELEPQSLPLGGAFDDARNVGHHERPVIAQLHDAKVGRERRERVVGDFRRRPGDDRQQGA